ncbi:MAG: hypothetical protein WB783_03810 [Arenicellales bacterium]
MTTLFCKRGALVLMSVSVLIGFSPVCAASGGDIDICKQVSAAQLKMLHRKRLYPTAYENECLWSEQPGGMALIDIKVRDAELPLRDYFANPLPSRFKLVKITDLGDDGLMTVGEGTLGVVAIRKGKRILLSSPGFLDIAPKSKKQTVLWDIYRDILKQM